MTLFGVTGALESSFRATLTVKADIGAVVIANNGDTEECTQSEAGRMVLKSTLRCTWRDTDEQV